MMNKTLHQDFPILKQKMRGKRLAYLDNAATTQKPQCVLDVLQNYYGTMNANIHRGVHHLSEQASQAFESTRKVVQKFINAKESKECIFVRSTTEAINLVANSFGQAFVKQGDEILISGLEHHSNIVPWQMLCERVSAHLKVIPLQENGDLDISECSKDEIPEVSKSEASLRATAKQSRNLSSYFSPKTKLLAIAHVSNSLGTLNPIKEMIRLAHAHGIPVLVDGAQAAPHLPIDVQALDCDFYAFSSHKTYGPTGVGVLYGKSKWLEAMPPYQGGGDMILKVSFEGTIYHDLPHKFEAGTPAIAEVIAFGRALEYLMSLDREALFQHEQALLNQAEEALMSFPGVKIIGTPKKRIGLISFILEKIHPHDVGTIVDQMGIAIRTGHHCAMPVMDYYQIAGTNRISFGLYNTEKDIEQLMEALWQVKKIFNRT